MVWGATTEQVTGMDGLAEWGARGTAEEHRRRREAPRQDGRARETGGKCERTKEMLANQTQVRTPGRQDPPSAATRTSLKAEAEPVGW